MALLFMLAYHGKTVVCQVTLLGDKVIRHTLYKKKNKTWIIKTILKTKTKHELLKLLKTTMYEKKPIINKTWLKLYW
jgi:hypothetical protein